MPIDIQKPCTPDSLMASSPPAAPWKAVCSDEYMSLPWKLNNTLSRTAVITDSSSTPSITQTRTLSRPVK
nr:hypothetical protein CPGR_01109 [Mycolicibacter nonchromogenicus]